MAKKGVIAAAVAGLFILSGGAWLYLSGQDEGQVAEACTASQARAERLAPLAVMDVAAFVPHTSSSRRLPDVAFADAEGKAMTLSDFKGRTVLLNLWATWCAPCREEMPEFDEVEADMGGAGFTILPLSLDAGDDAKPRAFYAEIGLEHLGLYHEGTMRAFNELKATGLVVGLPTTILIDESGCTLGHLSGPAKWASPSARALIAEAMKKTD